MFYAHEIFSTFTFSIIQTSSEGEMSRLVFRDLWRTRPMILSSVPPSPWDYWKYRKCLADPSFSLMLTHEQTAVSSLHNVQSPFLHGDGLWIFIFPMTDVYHNFLPLISIIWTWLFYSVPFQVPTPPWLPSTFYHQLVITSFYIKNQDLLFHSHCLPLFSLSVSL